MNPHINDIKKVVTKILQKYGIRKAFLFGSYVRDEQKPSSDIDIIVEFRDRKSLLDIVGIERELTEVLGVKVDLLTEKFISPYMIDSIRKEMKVIYE